MATLKKKKPEQLVTRTWKRDKTVNFMSVDVAAHNLQTNGGWLDGYKYPLSFEKAKRLLLDGDVLLTRHARFEAWRLPE